MNTTVTNASTPESGYVLVVDDEPAIRELLKEILEDEHLVVVTAEDAKSARACVARGRPDLVLLDIWLPDTDGVSLLREWSKGEPGGGGLDAPVVMMSGHATVETAVEATRLGAWDFLEKPISMAKLLVTVRRALEADRLRRENLKLRDHSRVLVGRSAPMRELRAAIEHAAPSDACVLIQGEPGSGKSLAARLLHESGPRRQGPFVVTRPGSAALGERFAEARGGTLLLRGIDELDAGAQAALHRLLDDTHGARIVATACRDVALLAQQHRFRDDLFYRLNVVPISLPPLRDHREDVPELAAYLLERAVDSEGLNWRRFTTAALNALRRYPWPGNVRELENVIQRLLITHSKGDIEESEVEQALGRPTLTTGDPWPPTLFEIPLREAREQFERVYLTRLLERSGGNVADVARRAEMERTHLYRKLKQLGIDIRTLGE